MLFLWRPGYETFVSGGTIVNADCASVFMMVSERVNLSYLVFKNLTVIFCLNLNFHENIKNPLLHKIQISFDNAKLKKISQVIFRGGSNSVYFLNQVRELFNLN